MLTVSSYIVLLLYAGWMPLQFSTDGAGAEFSEGIRAWSITPPEMLRSKDFKLNVVLFVPLGGLIAAAATGVWRRRWIAPAAIGVSAAVSMAIEAGQLLEPDRYMRLLDVLANTAGGAIGVAGGYVLFCRPMRRLWQRVAERLQGKHGLIASVAIALALIAGVAWQMDASLSLARRQWASTLWHPRDGLGVWPWHKWLVRWIAAYGALTLMLAAAHKNRSPGGAGVIRSVAIAVGLAAGIQAMHLFTPGTPPNMAAVTLAALAALGASLIAPRLSERKVELPVLVLGCAAAVVVMVVHIGWLATGGGTALPLWGLYRHEFAWGYYAMIRRWAVMGGFSFLIAFYLSLTQPWRLRRRMVIASAIATACAAALELVRLLSEGRVNTAGLIEHTIAAAAGTLVFALLWRILDRRADQVAEVAYDGPERRG